MDGKAPPGETTLMTVPGIGPKTAHRIREALQIGTLEELEVAAQDGRLRRVPGFGPRRVQMIRDLVAGMLSRSSHPAHRADDRAPAEPPSVATLLAVDEEYRADVDADALPKIAPRRFNPAGEAWLPILHTERDGWRFTALFSNTPRANDLHRTRDWVVIEFARDSEHGQTTVVTETRGGLSGRRVVRGREHECARYYAREASAA